MYNSLMKDIYDVKLTAKAKKDLKKVPFTYRFNELQAWIDAVGHSGLSEVRKIPGYHDEPLKGKPQEQRSIRLNIAYRAIYTINKDGVISFIEVEEVNKHEY